MHEYFPYVKQVQGNIGKNRIFFENNFKISPILLLIIK